MRKICNPHRPIKVRTGHRSPKMEQRAPKLSHVAIANGVLSFTGSERPDGSFTHFELRQTEEGKADLKLLN